MMIAVDANGADRGPATVAEGVRRSGVDALVFGPAAELGDAGERAQIIDAPVAVSGEDDPVRSVRERPEASVVQAAEAVGDDRAEALGSAGAPGRGLPAALVQTMRT